MQSRMDSPRTGTDCCKLRSTPHYARVLGKGTFSRLGLCIATVILSAGVTLPALARLHALGHLDTAFLGVRPWTRRSIARMLDEINDQEDVQAGSQAAEIVASVRREIGDGDDDPGEDAGRDFS